ncbi:MAG TPA: carboxymuconolactone decarboxylase family protein [Myxococcota bacterium]|nr:carboxymuconolactone decarboxylase family protein [Myxococcota bacterium]
MNARIPYDERAMKRVQPLLALQKQVDASGLDPRLLGLVEMRASQINGCAYCLDMHSKDARAAGESEQRLYGLDAWREAPYYSARERAALAWTESLTCVEETHVPDADWDEVRKQFSAEEILDLTLAVVLINSWNRIAIGFRMPPGHYKAGARFQGDARSQAKSP